MLDIAFKQVFSSASYLLIHLFTYLVLFTRNSGTHVPEYLLERVPGSKNYRKFLL